MSADAALLAFIVAGSAGILSTVAAALCTRWTIGTCKTWGYGVFLLVLVVMGVAMHGE